MYLPREICNYPANKVSNDNYFINVHNQFRSGEESEEYDLGIGYCHDMTKSSLKPGKFLFKNHTVPGPKLPN